ncbi:hypothetical protein H0W32_00685 [Patescibacteria group bacterium]|nr:hypothetical protein [Patescibacteria group bacterium]
MAIMYSLICVGCIILFLTLIFALILYVRRQEKKIVGVLTVLSERSDWRYDDLYTAIDERGVIINLISTELNYLLSDMIEANLLTQIDDHELQSLTVGGDSDRRYAITDKGEELLIDVENTGTSKLLSDVTMF